VLEEHPLAIDVPSEDVVVASPTLIETGPEHLPRLGEASTTKAPLAKDGTRAISLVGASGLMLSLRR